MKNKKAISLIVLVITIIVMLILASAIIITLSNTNIINKAKEAVNKTNDKVLAEQADVYAAELILEFRELGYNNLIVPDIAKQAYVDAIKAGKTEEEAKQIANESFIGTYDKWQCNGTMLCAVLSLYDPIYDEVLRVCELIWNENVTEVEELEIGKLAEVPEDLKKCIIAEQAAYSKAYAEAGTDGTHEAWDEYNAFWETNEPLKGLIDEDENSKYYYLTQALPIRIPRYVYNNAKTKIFDVTKCSEFYYLEGSVTPTQYDWNKVKQLTLDENFTVLTANIIPPVTGDCEIVLPNTLKTIKKQAFLNSTVTNITIPSGVKTIETGAFSRRINNSGIGIYGNGIVLENLVIKKEEGSIEGAPWGLNTTKTTILWQPE